MLILIAMTPAWQILHRAGVPLAGSRDGEPPTAEEIGQAVREVLAEPPSGREAEALAAFLFAWRHHFPTSFAALVGDEALSWARAQLPDDNRYLKLRRIAIANLSNVL